MSSTERPHPRNTRYGRISLTLIKNDRKKKTSYVPQNSPLEEKITLSSPFRTHLSHSPYPRTMEILTPYAEKRPSNLPRIFNIYSQVPNKLNQHIKRKTTPIGNIIEMDYKLWIYGKDIERFIRKLINIAEI
ncbi:hypothetical protein O181_064050 [Austropuccinia psidii MF-1]|uniref:Uncharacterized protein n=1 Tax=Austropuccinia psidii MF-1 TaxID=1389203 RepID=A0A9Q3I2R0_9BASI|nr:hypothetical protein [Austropuccinia psidii MF-1]